jgi:hypothetical protein
MFRPFADWLDQTAASQLLQDQAWVVPTSQSIHIIAVSVVFACACAINLRLLGLGKSSWSARQVTSSLLPWMWRGLAVLLLTGLTQTLTEPVRQFVTPLFWAKMLMIVVVTTITALYVRSLRTSSASNAEPERPPHGRLFALTSTLLWLAIIVCGRFIGYTWSFYA